MDFLIELLFEVIGEVFLENGVEIAACHRLPKWLRVLILACTALAFAAVFGIILAVGIKSLREAPPLSLLMFAMDLVLVFWCVYQVRKVLRILPRQ